MDAIWMSWLWDKRHTGCASFTRRIEAVVVITNTSLAGHTSVAFPFPLPARLACLATSLPLGRHPDVGESEHDLVERGMARSLEVLAVARVALCSPFLLTARKPLHLGGNILLLVRFYLSSISYHRGTAKRLIIIVNPLLQHLPNS
jgi:hypothetical protein